jgi:hypothetical protein
MYVAKVILAKIVPKDTVDKLNKSKLSGNVNVLCCHWLAAGGTAAASAEQRTQQPTITKRGNDRWRLAMRAPPLPRYDVLVIALPSIQTAAVTVAEVVAVAGDLTGSPL